MCIPYSRYCPCTVRERRRAAVMEVRSATGGSARLRSVSLRELTSPEVKMPPPTSAHQRFNPPKARFLNLLTEFPLSFQRITKLLKHPYTYTTPALLPISRFRKTQKGSERLAVSLAFVATVGSPALSFQGISALSALQVPFSTLLRDLPYVHSSPALQSSKGCRKHCHLTIRCFNCDLSPFCFVELQPMLTSKT